MAPNSGRKGTKAEREIARYLDPRGFVIVRAPASGAATDRELPDLIVARDVRVAAIEAKSSSGDPIYIGGGEVDDLQHVARHFGADARIAVRFDLEYGDPFYGAEAPPIYLFAPEDLHETGGGNYRVKKETAQAEGTPITTFARR